MSRRAKQVALWVGAAALLCAIVLFGLAQKPAPERISYGISFNTPYAAELGLDTREVYDAFLDDLGVRHLRLAAHWPLVEPEQDGYNFSELDYQIRRAQEEGADVILAVGRRLPRWPECHVPEWAAELSWEEQKAELRAYLTEVIERYRDEPHITYWQVENEPFLEVFAYEQCGDLDEAFLAEEIELVRTLDPTRPILVTDSGNIGTWHDAYRAGDAFGTSMYLYLWNPDIGPFRTFLPAVAYRMKENLMHLLFGEKQTFLIELAAEPWLLEPVTEVSLEAQFSRMDPEKFEEILTYARDARFARQYLWGGEWWYWLKLQGHPEMWERGKRLFETGE